MLDHGRVDIETYNAAGAWQRSFEAVRDLFSSSRVRVFETAPLEVDEDAALVEGTGRIRDALAADLGRYVALYAELVSERPRVFETAPGTEADEVALVERTRRIRDWWSGSVSACPHPSFVRRWPADAHHSEVDYEDAVTGTVDYKKAVSRDSTIEEMWAKMEGLGIMKD